MPWTFNVSAAIRRERTVALFGTLAFTGSYTTNGDPSGTLAFGASTIGYSNELDESVLHSARPPLSGFVTLEAGYQGALNPQGGSGPIPAIKIWLTTTGAELAAGAYPGALGGLCQMMLEYEKNR